MKPRYSVLNTDPQGPGWSLNAILGTAVATLHFGMVFWLTFIAPQADWYRIETWIWGPVGLSGYFVFMGWRDIKTDHKQGTLIVTVGALLMAATTLMALSQYV